MTQPLLERIIIEPSQKATSSVIWLHGLGASGDDFSGIIPMLHLSSTHRVRFIFPHAPHRAVTINGGVRMPAWYDISHMDLAERQDEAGIVSSEKRLQDLIARERQLGIPARKIISMGFSQGGAVAVYAAVRHNESLAGVAVLSSYLPLQNSVEEQRHLTNLSIPIFIAHGTQDPVVPFSQGQQTRDLLGKLGYEPLFRSYAMAHAVCPQECQDLGQWMQNSLMGQ